MDSQTLKIGNTDSDTDNDFTGVSDSSYRSKDSDGKDGKKAKITHMSWDDAIGAIRQEQQKEQLETNNLAQPTPKSSEYDNDVYEYPEDEEWSIERQLRLLREEEERQRAGLGGRLTAPAEEVRRRYNRKPSTVNKRDDLITELREKQMKLLDEQTKLQKLLQEEAKERIQEAKHRIEEAKDRRRLVSAQRECAEIELRLKKNECNESNEQQ